MDSRQIDQPDNNHILTFNSHPQTMAKPTVVKENPIPPVNELWEPWDALCKDELKESTEQYALFPPNTFPAHPR